MSKPVTGTVRCKCILVNNIHIFKGIIKCLIGYVSTGLPKSLSLQDTSVSGNYVREKSSFTDTDDFPPKILTAAHLSSLRDLLSDKKITGEFFVVVVVVVKLARISQAVMQRVSLSCQRK